MKIIFDLRSTGLGNNGGSLTLIKSGNTLVDLGHEVYFVDTFRNMNTWTPLNAKHIIVKNKNQLPDADVIIATGYKSVALTVQAPKRCGLKIHWLRGWETWQMPDERIIERVLKAPTLKLVNGIGLQEKLNKYGFKSQLIRPGYDLHELYPTGKREENSDIVIGGLYHQKHSGIKRVSWLLDVWSYLKSKRKGVKLHLMGATKPPSLTIDKYITNPTIKDKNYFYNEIDIWMAPAMQEGLHMPPAEAMLTECPIVTTTNPMSGTQDYALHEYNGLVSDDNYLSFQNSVEALVKDKKARKTMGKRARESIVELGSRQENMLKLLQLIKDNI